MTAEVFFADARERRKSLPERVKQLFSRASFIDLIEEDDLVAVKVHFGERGNTAYVSPVLVSKIVERIRECGGKPFLTDTNTLYRGYRANAFDHLETAIANGFAYSVVKAPILISDGLRGRDYVRVPVKGEHFKEVKISSALYHADVIITVSHFKGHELTGFAGAIKNIGMGSGSPAGKQMMHSDILPEVNWTKCTACKECIRWCPSEAISIVQKRNSKKARIDPEKCIGCGECVVTCPEDAIAINWQGSPGVTQQKIVEYAWGAIKDKPEKTGFINFVINVTPSCDCERWSDMPIVPDCGVLASTDPVAIDQASVDLVNQKSGIEETALSDLQAADKFRSLYKDVDWEVQLNHGESIGIGTRKYNLIKIN